VLRKEKVAKLIDWFRKSSVRHAEAMENLQEEVAAAQVGELNRFYAAVLREGALDLFLTLLDDEDARVAGMAAVYAMRDEPGRCREVLVRLSALPGLMGFRAQSALQRWDSGDWNN
jgi:hypothetical protein